jgi:uncharacterized membrane protein YkoI
MRKVLVSLFSSLCVMAVTVAAFAPTLAWADMDDQDRARKAMLSGDVRPLTELLAHVEKTYAGKVLKVELERDDSGARVDDKGEPILLYEMKLLTPQGNLVKLEYDARTLQLLTVRGHDSQKAHKGHKSDD